jgi:hypothetical protein
MAQVLASIEEDDDGTTQVPGRRKRQVEDEPEEFSTIPGGVGHNPMAPTKRRRKDQTQPLHTPSLLPLQPAHPEQLPPRPQAHLPQSLTSTIQPLGPQSVPPARLTGSQPLRPQPVPLA